MPDLPAGVECMKNTNVKLDEGLRSWLLTEAAREGRTLSGAVRTWLRLAYKYRHSITEAENAPATFVRVRGRTVGGP